MPAQSPQNVTEARKRKDSESPTREQQIVLTVDSNSVRAELVSNVALGAGE